MLLETLEKYYGEFSEPEQDFIHKSVEILDAATQEAFYKNLTEFWGKRKGVPDLSVLSKTLRIVAPNKARVYFWAICDDCGAEYDYRFMQCPRCFLEGKKNSGYSVKKSEYQPPMKIIRWNQFTLSPSTIQVRHCVDCVEKKFYCPIFGNPDKQCKAQDFEYCPCKKCCAYFKKANKDVGNVNRS